VSTRELFQFVDRWHGLVARGTGIADVGGEQEQMARRFRRILIAL
jgi:hypothetical protein